MHFISLFAVGECTHPGHCKLQKLEGSTTSPNGRESTVELCAR